MAAEFKNVTRRDVAQLAGVSETIVSYVLNNNRYVAQDKRERVLAAVRQLHYRPNSIARALKGKRSNHILFIADNISNEHFGKIVEEMDKIAYDKGYLISLLASRNSSEFVAQVISRQVDGIVISSTSFAEQYVLQLLDSGIPVVLLMNRDYPNVGNRASKIHTGIQNGIRECVRLLAQKGHRNIVYLDRVSRHGNFSTMEDLRYRGFCAEMQASGLHFDENSILTGFANEEALYTAIQQRMRSGHALDGIVARNDNLACLAIAALRELEIAIPAQVAVIGFDNSRISKFIQPTLSTIETDRAAIAHSIITMLDDMISGNAPSTQHHAAHLIERAST